VSDRKKILRAINREARQIRDPKARRVFRRAAVQTGLVESNLSNPSGGDADSAGWRQERASLYKNPTNIKASARRFRQEFQQMYDPGEKSYEVAAQVQRPAAQYRGRYKERAAEAEQILKGQPNTNEGSTRVPASYKTVPGVDNSQARQALKLSYLENRHDPDALLSLASGLKGAQDTPDRRVKVKGSRPAQRSSAGPVAHSSLHGIASDIDALASRYGAPITAKQEPGHATGGDHDPAVKGATARDIGGSEEARKRIFKRLTRQLGV
jgi:hypothetical protein